MTACIALAVGCHADAEERGTDGGGSVETNTGTAMVEVTVPLPQSRDGQMIVALFDGASGFPADFDAAIRKVVVTLDGPAASVAFESIPPGEYAVCVLHDEDASGSLTTNFLGIPKEGLGVSLNPTGRLGPPRFEDARFRHNGGTRLSIDLWYP